MKKNGYTVVELLVLMAVVGVIYFVVANKVSYAFDYNYEEELYKQTIASIEKGAKIYGEQNKTLFDEEKDVYITAEELAKEGFVLNNTEFSIIDPRDAKKTLNDIKVKITYEEEKVTAKALV